MDQAGRLFIICSVLIAALVGQFVLRPKLIVKANGYTQQRRNVLWVMRFFGLMVIASGIHHLVNYNEPFGIWSFVVSLLHTLGLYGIMWKAIKAFSFKPPEE